VNLKQPKRFFLSRHRSDSVLVSITFLGERVEVDVFDDGHMAVSRFRGNEDVVGGEELVRKLIAELGSPLSRL